MASINTIPNLQIEMSSDKMKLLHIYVQYLELVYEKQHYSKPLAFRPMILNRDYLMLSVNFQNPIGASQLLFPDL
jgi:hypothetical protein